MDRKYKTLCPQAIRVLAYTESPSSSYQIKLYNPNLIRGGVSVHFTGKKTRIVINKASSWYFSFFVLSWMYAALSHLNTPRAYWKATPVAHSYRSFPSYDRHNAANPGTRAAPTALHCQQRRATPTRSFPTRATGPKWTKVIRAVTQAVTSYSSPAA